MIIACPSWVMGLFVVWMLVQICWTVHRWRQRHYDLDSMIAAQFKNMAWLSSLQVENQILRSNLATKGRFSKKGTTVGINTKDLSPEDKSKIKDLGGTIL